MNCFVAENVINKLDWLISTNFACFSSIRKIIVYFYKFSFVVLFVLLNCSNFGYNVLHCIIASHFGIDVIFWQA